MGMFNHPINPYFYKFVQPMTEEEIRVSDSKKLILGAKND